MLHGASGGATMTHRSPGRFWFPPHPPARVLLMYTRTTSLPSLYIRNIIPDDMSIPLLGYRALSGWGEAFKIGIYAVHRLLAVATINLDVFRVFVGNDYQGPLTIKVIPVSILVSQQSALWALCSGYLDTVQGCEILT